MPRGTQELNERIAFEKGNMMDLFAGDEAVENTRPLKEKITADD